MSKLTAGQWLDWVRFDRQFTLAFNREDMLWALARADQAPHGPGDPDVSWQDFDPYCDPLAFLDEELTVEQMREKIGRGNR